MGELLVVFGLCNPGLREASTKSLEWERFEDSTDGSLRASLCVRLSRLEFGIRMTTRLIGLECVWTRCLDLDGLGGLLFVYTPDVEGRGDWKAML